MPTPVRPLLLWGIQILSNRYLGRSSPLSVPGDREAFVRRALSLTGPGDRLWGEAFAPSDTLYPLRSVFADLWLVEEPYLEDVYLYPRADFSEIVYPEAYGDLRADSRFSVWRDRLSHVLDRLDETCLDEYLLTFLQRFGVYVPVLNEKDCSLSLYDYLKPTAALAGCLEDAGAPRWKLVLGDLSGVQDFIYTTSTRWALKALRGGSFYLEMLTRHLALDIVQKNGLGSCNILYAGGGKFYVVLPDRPGLEEDLEDVQHRVNGFLLDTFNGRLHMAFGWTDLAEADLAGQGIAPVWERLTEQVNREKRRPFHHALRAGLLTAEEPDLNQECEVCHRDTGEIREEGGSHLCKFHSQLIQAGRNLWCYDRILGLRSAAPQHEFASLQMPSLLYDRPVYYTVARRDDDVDRILDASQIFRRYAVNDPDAILDGGRTLSMLPVFCEDHVKTDESREEQAAPFDYMAKQAIGADLIGTLRMDVDNLGRLFADGLQPDKGVPFSRLCHLSSLSRYFEYFFKFHLNGICKGRLGGDLTQVQVLSNLHRPEHRARPVSIVYAGGDDLFVVGAWNAAAELAFDIQACFCRYTCKHPDVGISGGLVVHQPKFPVYIAAQEAKEAEARAKDNLEPSDFARAGALLFEERAEKPYLARKNSIALFYDREADAEARRLREDYKDLQGDEADRIPMALKWDEARRYILCPLQEIFVPALAALEGGENGRVKLKIPRAFLSKLYAVVVRWREEEAGVLYLPDLVYHGARALSRLPENQVGPAKKILDRYRLYRKGPEDRLEIRYLHTVLTWAELLIREKGGKGRV